MNDCDSARELEVLSEAECFRLLRSRTVGRIGLVNQGQPLIFPVNYVAHEKAIIFRTAPGTKLRWAPMSRVAFEIDDVSEGGTAWSVLAQGVAYEITEAGDRQSEWLRTLVLEPMAPGERKHWVAIHVSEVSGRRFQMRQGGPTSAADLGPAAGVPTD